MLGTQSIHIIAGDYLAAGELGTRVGELIESCSHAQVPGRDPGQSASCVAAFGPPDGWPRGPRAVARDGRAFVWFEGLMEPSDYVAARERVADPVFLHGEHGLEHLESVLTGYGLSRDYAAVDEAGVDALFQLKGEYLKQLIREFRDFLAAHPDEEPEIVASWRTFLQRVEGSAGTYEFGELSEAARRAKGLFDVTPLPEQTEEAAADLITTAINSAAEGHRQQISERLPDRISSDARHRALILATDAKVGQQLRLALTHSEQEALVHSDPATFFEALQLVHPDVLVIQQSLAGFDGFDLAAQLRQDPSFGALPIVGLLDDIAESTRTRAARCGVDSWLVRPFSADNAVHTVKAVVERSDAHLALGGRDPVTGLFGKRALLDRLELELLRARRAAELVALMLVHIESFPSDRYPRQLLVELARTVESTFRRSDILGRYNERTVAAVLPGADPRIVASLIDRLIDSAPAGVRLRIAASIAEGSVPAQMVSADAETRMIHALDGQPGAAVGRCAATPDVRDRGAHAPRVLLVDNDEAILTLLRFFCEREGFVVDEARDGLTAIEALDRANRSNELPDLVILEAYLPGVDGFSVLRKVQADFGARVGVMMLTIQRNEERIAKAFNLGAADFVAKPFSVPEVMARIKNILLRAGAL